MQNWFGNKPTMSQQATKGKYEKVLLHGHTLLHSDEVVLKVIEAEFDKKGGRELDGILVLTADRLLFIAKHEHHAFRYTDIKNMEIDIDGKDKKEWKLTLFLGRYKQTFDDIKKNDDAQEFFDVLEEKVLHPNTDILTTVTHDFTYFLHADRLEKLRQNGSKPTPFLMKRDDMGFSKNGMRLLQEKYPDALLIVEGCYHEKNKKGNFIVIDKLVYLYEYDNDARKAKKIVEWPFSFFNHMSVDHFAIKSEIVGNDGKLVLNQSGKQFVSILSNEGVSFKIKERKWYQKIVGFRSGKWWKATIASFSYGFILLIAAIVTFADEPEEVKKDMPAAKQVVSTTVDNNQQHSEEANKKEEAARLAAEQRKKEEEAKRVAEEKRKLEEAARLAVEQRKEEEAKRIAEEKRKQEEAARLAVEQQRLEEQKQTVTTVYYKNCTAVRAAGAAPIYRGEPGYAKHLDRDGDGVACE